MTSVLGRYIELVPQDLRTRTDVFQVFCIYRLGYMADPLIASTTGNTTRMSHGVGGKVPFFAECE